jgi:hypothetical protein
MTLYSLRRWQRQIEGAGPEGPYMLLVDSLKAMKESAIDEWTITRSIAMHT